ncbi:MAG: hypothetical protein AABO41_09615 [Acidobacteriota bacterium]
MASKKKRSQSKQPPNLQVAGHVTLERVREILHKDDKAVFRVVATRQRLTSVFPEPANDGRRKR